MPLVRECYEMSETEMARLSSTLIVKFHVSNEPEIAGLVTEFQWRDWRTKLLLSIPD